MMRPASRAKSGVSRLCVGVIVAAALAGVAGSRHVCAQPCTAGGDTWRIYNEWQNAQYSDSAGGKTTGHRRTTANGSQHSDNGQDVTDSTTHQGDNDGRAQESERLCANGTLLDPMKKRGKPCWNDDGSVSTLSRDWDRDAAGNTVETMTMTTVTKDGDKTTTTREKTCDSQGQCSTKENTKQEKVDPPDPHACDRPYWTGSITVDEKIDSVTRPDQPFGFGIGRNQQATITEEVHSRDHIEVTLVAASAFAASRSPDAMIMRTFDRNYTKDIGASQELWCDEKWQGWTRQYKKVEAAHGTGSARGTVGVSLSSDGSFSIGFYGPEATGTSSLNETDNISPGKCWGTARNPQLSFSNPARWSGNSFGASGKTDPKNQTTLTGRDGNMRWSLTRFDPKVSKLEKQ